MKQHHYSIWDERVTYFVKRVMFMCISWWCLRHVRRRLWLTPNVGGKPEMLSCYDFEPTGTNDLRSLVAKINRKLSRNQFKGQLTFSMYLSKILRQSVLSNISHRLVLFRILTVILKLTQKLVRISCCFDFVAGVDRALRIINNRYMT